MKLALSNTHLLILVVILVIVAIIYFYTNQKPTKQLVYYFSPKCPHCVEFMPEWEKVQVVIPKSKINCTTQDCPGIQALPTVILENNGIKTEYEGERTKKAIETFVTKNI